MLRISYYQHPILHISLRLDRLKAWVHFWPKSVSSLWIHISQRNTRKANKQKQNQRWQAILFLAGFPNRALFNVYQNWAIKFYKILCIWLDLFFPLLPAPKGSKRAKYRKTEQLSAGKDNIPLYTATPWHRHTPALSHPCTPAGLTSVDFPKGPLSSPSDARVDRSHRLQWRKIRRQCQCPSPTPTPLRWPPTQGRSQKGRLPCRQPPGALRQSRPRGRRGSGTPSASELPRWSCPLCLWEAAGGGTQRRGHSLGTACN